MSATHDRVSVIAWEGDTVMDTRPNIVMIVADDHRFTGVHAFGTPTVQTPTLDALAARGVTCQRTYIMGGLTEAVCIPSRACLLTGANVLRASMRPEIGDAEGLMTINPALATLPATMRHAGYHTYSVGKWHNDPQAFADGFCDGSRIFFGGMSDHWHVPVHDFDPLGVYAAADRYDTGQFSTTMFSDAAIAFLQDYQRDEPFFLYLAYTAPHDPRTPPPGFDDRYDPANIPLPENFLPVHPFDNGELRVRDELLAPWPRTPEIVRKQIADYYGMISHLDAEVGRVLATLAQREDAANTIVVYTADHGLAMGQHGLMGKQNLYEHSVRVPMILAGPGLPAGTRIPALTYAADLFPTLCTLTTTPIPATVESRSLMPLITGARDSLRSSVFALYKDVQRMVADGRWKLIRHYRSAERQVGSDRIQLFDLKDDPWEMHDRSRDSAQQEYLYRLAEKLADWQRHVNDPLAESPVLVA